MAERSRYEHLSLQEDTSDATSQHHHHHSEAPAAAGATSTTTNEEEEVVEITIDNAVERLGMGRFQYSILIASGLCFAADAMQVVLLSFLTVVLQQDWQLSSEQAAAITSSLFAGSFVGTLFLGPLADSIGRRPVFLLGALEISVASMGASMAPNYGVLILMIFLVGVGVGGLTVPFDILAEFLPSSGRGHNLLMIQYFWTIGCLYVVLAAHTTLGQDQWRGFVAICALPCLTSAVVGYLYVPESARWLATTGQTAQALTILRQAAVKNGLDVDFVFPDNLVLAPEQRHQEATVADLLKPKWRKITLFMWGTWFAFPFGYYGTIMTTTRVFADHQSSRSIGYGFDYTAIFVSSAAELIGLTLVIVAVDRIGRIPSQVLSYFLAGVSLFFLCTAASWGTSSRWMLVALGFAARIFEMSGTCVTWVSTAEILTTDVRGTGHSMANAVARAGAFVCPFLVEGKTPLERVGMVMLLTHAFTIACVSQLPETKGRDMGVATEDQVGFEQDDYDDHHHGDELLVAGEDFTNESSNDHGHLL